MSNNVGLDSIELIAPFLPMDFSLNSNVNLRQQQQEERYDG